MRNLPKEFVEKTGVKAGDVADLLGISDSAISMKLSGQRPFKPAELAALRDFFNRPENLAKLGRGDSSPVAEKAS
jgi:predicted transcriptional regulator